MGTKIQKWGNSLAVRLPKEVARSLNLKEGSEVVMRQAEKRIVIQRVPELSKAMHTKEAWKTFLVPTVKQRENVSGMVDEILYGVSS